MPPLTPHDGGSNFVHSRKPNIRVPKDFLLDRYSERKFFRVGLGDTMHESFQVPEAFDPCWKKRHLLTLCRFYANMYTFR